MGYEIAGAWGAKMARPDGDVIAFVGDGSYLMLNSDLYSSVLTGQKLIVIVCDNGGFAVIERLQTGQGGRSFNNMLVATGDERLRVDWAAHARVARLRRRGGRVRSPSSRSAFERARGRGSHDRDRDRDRAARAGRRAARSGRSAWRRCRERQEIAAAHERLLEGKSRQRVGW